MSTWNRRRFLLATLALLPAACADLQPAPPDPRRAAVDRLISRLQQDLKSDRWDWIDWAFSPDFREGPSIRNRWEARWTRYHTVDLQLIPGRMLETGGVLNVQVRWNRVLRDRSGQFQRSSGTAEVILEPSGNDYRIRQILGASFL